MDKQLKEKMKDQYKAANRQRHLIISSLKQQVYELENHPLETWNRRFPFVDPPIGANSSSQQIKERKPPNDKPR